MWTDTLSFRIHSCLHSVLRPQLEISRSETNVQFVLLQSIDFFSPDIFPCSCAMMVTHWTRSIVLCSLCIVGNWYDAVHSSHTTPPASNGMAVVHIWPDGNSRSNCGNDFSSRILGRPSVISVQLMCHDKGPNFNPKSQQSSWIFPTSYLYKERWNIFWNTCISVIIAIGTYV